MFCGAFNKYTCFDWQTEAHVKYLIHLSCTGLFNISLYLYILHVLNCNFIIATTNIFK